MTDLYRKKMSKYLVDLMLGLKFIIICVLFCKTFRLKCVIKWIERNNTRRINETRRRKYSWKKVKV